MFDELADNLQKIFKNLRGKSFLMDMFSGQGQGLETLKSIMPPNMQQGFRPQGKLSKGFKPKKKS